MQEKPEPNYDPSRVHDPSRVDASANPSLLPGTPLSESKRAVSESCPPLSGWQIWSGHGIRLSFWCVFAATLLFVGAVAVARFWLIPNADSFRPRVVSELSRLTGQRVAIGGFEAGWNGWSPELKLTKLQIMDVRGKPLLVLPDVETTISWRSLFLFEPRLSALTIRAPRLVVRRTAQNSLTVAGIDVDLTGQSEGDPGLVDWLLKQRMVQIVGGEIEWQDDWRKLPPLRLSNVNIRLLNSGSQHNIGLTAVPPQELASPIDFRGNFSGTDLKKINDWAGLAYLRTDYANLGLFTRYFPLPVEISRGDGGLQVWFEIDDGQPVAVTTDMVVRQARLRMPSGASLTPVATGHAAVGALRSDSVAALLEPLELATLTGRMSWRNKTIAGGDAKAALTQQRWSVRDMSAVTAEGVKTSAITGEVIVDFRGDEMTGGAVRLSELDLGSLNAIAKSLPMTGALRSQLLHSQPTGMVRAVDAKWRDQSPRSAKSGDAALVRYAVEGSAELSNLSWREHDGVPGVSGLSASLKGSTREGEILLGAHGVNEASSAAKLLAALLPASKNKEAKSQAKTALKSPPLATPIVLDFGKRFDAPLTFDRLHGALKWTRKADANNIVVTTVDTSLLTFENADMAGTISGTWHSDSLGPGVANLTGTLSRGDVTATHRYLPVAQAPQARAWLRLAVLGGTAHEGRFVVKGPLWHFPFRDDREGILEVSGQVKGGVLDYADRWPRAENIDTKVTFRGTSITAQVTAATIAGVPIAATYVKLDDTASETPKLEIRGSATAPVNDFLQWVVASPVNAWLDGFLQTAKATGNGRLNLALTLPLEAMDKSRIAGEFVFAGNRLELGGDIPPLDNVNGSVRFSEADFRSENVTAEALGGPLKVAITTDAGRVKTQASGTALFERVREQYAYPGLDQLAGQTQWQLETVQPTRQVGGANAAPETLMNLSLTTVQPKWPLDGVFQVTAAQRDATLPMQISMQRAALDKGRDRLTIEVPGQLHAILERGAASAVGVRVVERATLDIGAQKTALPVRGYALRGEVLKLDADAAIVFLNHPSVMGKKSVGGLPSESTSADFVNINLRATEAVLYAHKFNDVTLRAQPTGQRWRLALRSKEATGTISLDTSADNGSVDAVAIRLQRLSWPTPVANSALVVVTDKPSPSADNQRWPKLDLTADSFVSDGREFGKLEMRAQPAPDEWRIEQVKLTNADGSIEAKGRWRTKGGPAALGDTAVDVTLNWSDAGKFMARFGLPKGVDRGGGSLAGSVSWAGSPAQFSYAKLGGKFALETAQGRFTEMEPGIGKLLGVLSLQAIPRRLSLNFDDLFGKGLAFDEIKADVAINDGVASTDSLTIYGPSSRVLIRGSADMNRETQDLQVRVFPSLSTATAIGIGLATANPAIGAAALLGQKLAKDPIERFLMREFAVKGTWANPDVRQSGDAAPTPVVSGPAVTRVE